MVINIPTTEIPAPIMVLCQKKSAPLLGGQGCPGGQRFHYIYNFVLTQGHCKQLFRVFLISKRNFDYKE